MHANTHREQEEGNIYWHIGYLFGMPCLTWVVRDCRGWDVCKGLGKKDPRGGLKCVSELRIVRSHDCADTLHKEKGLLRSENP